MPSSTSCAACPARCRPNGCASTSRRPARARTTDAGDAPRLGRLSRADRERRRHDRLDLGDAPRASGAPSAAETRLLAAAADQLGQAVAHDRLAAEAHSAEVARESDALKSALLQSVSHDLRTPLATIRAAAGTLRSDTAIDSDVTRESVDAIEREVEYLNRLVSNLLDLIAHRGRRAPGIARHVRAGRSRARHD